MWRLSFGEFFSAPINIRMLNKVRKYDCSKSNTAHLRFRQFIIPVPNIFVTLIWLPILVFLNKAVDIICTPSWCLVCRKSCILCSVKLYCGQALSGQVGYVYSAYLNEVPSSRSSSVISVDVKVVYCYPKWVKLLVVLIVFCSPLVSV